MPDAETSRADQLLDRELELAFAPLHKRHLGVAVALVAAASLFALTALHVLRAPADPYPLVLLDRYLPGYEVSWKGALIGAFWALWVGFVVGWFFAFARNFVIAAARIIFRAKAELAANRGFLDHI